MASTALSASACAAANMSRFPDPTVETDREDGDQQRIAAPQKNRWAVCLNKPTVASLRRHAVISTTRTRSHVNTSAMPVATSSHSLLSSLPTFPSVFGSEGAQPNNAGITSSSRPPSRSQQKLNAHQSGSHTRRGSSATTESTESSPTTTISTVDSTLTDPSPSSSPESPNILVPTLSSLKDSDQTPVIPSMESSRTLSLTPSPTRQGERSRSPNKRPRNAKGLSINTTGISTRQAPHTAAFAGPALNRLIDSSAASLPTGSAPKLGASSIPGHVGARDAGRDSRPFSEPSSPSFILPSMPPPRRSKLGLTITTPDLRSGHFGAVPQTPLRGMAPLPLRTRASDLTARLNTVPETPGFGPLSAMREGDEGKPLFSPSLAPQGGMQLPPFGNVADPTLPTPSFGPDGGMRLPSTCSSESSPYSKAMRPPLSLPRYSFDAPGSSTVVQHTIEHNPSTPLHELPLSREAKSPGYPDGPICIYPPSVYLYHQPTRQEAREFDVIINVAREVPNPFTEPDEAPPAPAPAPEPRYKDAGVQCTLLPGPEEKSPAEAVPPSAASEVSFASAFESLPDDEGPETPKATSPKSFEPEYIHLPWEHNSKVYEDWLRICELIDKRVKEGKRVLVHCQLGVSRSASLIVAYGIYKNPFLSPDEAREQAKRQSRFIDLNMHFMYELGDFKKLLADKLPQTQTLRRPGGQKPLARTMTDSVLATGSHGREPMSPISDETDTESGAAGEPSPSKTQFANAPSLDTAVAGPSSAPAGRQWSPTGIPQEYQEPEDGANRIADPEPEPEPEPETARPIEKKPVLELQPGPPLSLKLPERQSTPMVNQTKEASLPLPNLAAGEVTPVPSESEKQGTTSHPPTLNLNQLPRPHVENQAENTESLPGPSLSLPITHTNHTPRRTIRPMPSLPAGFNSTAHRRPEPQFPPMAGMVGMSLDLPTLKSPAVVEGPENDILSPRAAEFTATPFHRSVRSLAGDLAEPMSGLMSPRDHDRDPRSPPTRGEVVVLRNIDDILG